MTTRRTLSIGAAAIFLLGALTACFPPLPGTPGNPGNPGGEPGTETATLSGTWSGTDSDTDEWVLEFQADHTIGVSFNGDGPSDQPGDTWSLSGTDLTLTVTGFENGNITCDGTFDGGDAIPLTCSYAGRPFTLTLSPA